MRHNLIELGNRANNGIEGRLDIRPKILGNRHMFMRKRPEPILKMDFTDIRKNFI